MPSRRSGADIEALGIKAVWLALALLFLGIGLQKLTGYEANAIRPFAQASLLLAWAYRAFGVHGASLLFAAVEIPTGLGLALGVVRPGSKLALAGAVGALATSLVTTSFLLTTRGAFIPHRPLPLFSLQVGQFFFKDLALVAGALLALGNSLKSR